MESFRSTGSVGISSLRAEKAVFTLKVKVNHKAPKDGSAKEPMGLKVKVRVKSNLMNRSIATK